MFMSNRKFNELIARIETIEQTGGTVETPKLNIISDKNVFGNDEKKKVAYALNLCTVSISQIIDYNDLYILEQEYDAILNNLNLQNFIKDEALLNVLKQILDTITFFKIQEGNKKFIEKEYQHKMKNAIWSAVPNLSVILAGGNPVQMAIAAATQVGIGYMNYRKNKSQYNLDRDNQEWELQRSAMEQFNGLRRELFETAWRLSDAYDFDDVFRLTEKQIGQYNAILIDPDPLRRYERLESLERLDESTSKRFEAFPPFWYFKGNAAREIYRDENYSDLREEFKQNALSAFHKFDDVYVEFMREDILAASCALEHISLLHIEKDKKEIHVLLKKAIHLAGDNFDILQMCVLAYVALNQPAEAIGILKRLVNEEYNLEYNGLLLSRAYLKDGKKADYHILENRIGKSNILPWIENDDEAEREYVEYRTGEVKRRFNLFVDCLTDKHYSVFISYRYYDTVSKIKRFLSSGVSYQITTSLNLLFNELNNLLPFAESKAINWCSFFEESAKEVNERLSEIKSLERNAQDFFSEGTHKLHEFRTDHNDNVVMVQKIDQILVKTTELYSFFFEMLKSNFENGFSVQSVSLADSIINHIDLWYTNNNRSIPANDKAFDELVVVRSQKLYFE